ncbi:MAG: dihydrodipicolinate synthase family protein [Paraburkholderia sp.]|uniref:dihydrodipicolinate synthase family protein n=1 Tax=Paraburkholderia sp. TaxID=1926495 RepID=UPI003C421B3E
MGTTLPIDGIIPVMLTPFTAANEIDYRSLGKLIEWYINNGADTLFAVCQSSEMQKLTRRERVDVSRFVVEQVAGRVPVIASGHISDDADEQYAELSEVGATGVDGIVLVTNRLDPHRKGGRTFLDDLDRLLARLPKDLPLGLYECPAPYRRLLSDEELLYCANTGRFVVLKDVSCDLATVAHRVELVKGTPLRIVNANAAIAYAAMKAGSRGFCGVFNNFHPDLYKWLLQHGDEDQDLADELAIFLALAAMAEPMGYPKLAKQYQQRLGIFESDHTRVIEGDIRERFWAIDALVDHIDAGTARFRERIAARAAARKAA